MTTLNSENLKVIWQKVKNTEMIIAQLQVETGNHRNTIGEQSHSIQEHTDYPLHNVMSPRRYFVNRFIFIEFGKKKKGEDEAADYSHWI